MPTRKSNEPQRTSSGWALRAVIAVVLLLGGGAAYYFYFRAPAGPSLSLEFSKPDQILLGQPFIITVSFSNYSDNILKDTRLSLFLPEGVSFLGQFADQRVIEQALGDVGPGSLNQQKFNLIVTSGSQTLKRLEAKLLYSTAVNAKTQFESRADVDLAIGQPAIAVTLETPTNVFNGEEFEMKVKYENNTSQEFKNFQLKLDYPPIFQFKRSSIDPQTNTNNVWTVSKLDQGVGGEITITGSVIGPEQSFFSMNGTLTADFLGQSYALNTQTATIGIAEAPISIRVAVNGSGSDYVVHAGELLKYAVTYKNNASVAFQNITVRVGLAGEMVDFSSLHTNASLNSLTNTLTWSSANAPELASLNPGEEKTLEFDIKVRDTFPIKRISDKNYALKLRAQIESPTVLPNTSAEKTISVANLENKIAGKVRIDAQAYFRDAASGILNSGFYPPQVNKPTQYTIHWIITNYATDVTNVKVSAYLQSGAWFTGKVKSNMGTLPVFDADAGLVTWEIPTLPATKGIVSQAAEAVFQIEATPAVNQVGQSMPVLGETKIEAQDVFTGLALNESDAALTTDLPDDKTIPTDADRRVQP